MTDKDFVDLLFKPSFSTADKITDVSGRGVGLDVVKTKIEALGGKHNSQNSSRRGKYFYDPASADTGYHPGIDGTGWGRKICDSTWQYQWH